ncbi:42928_t:CDS:2 [Gigaspora margarita]|uniref:42928_t:CDS:1 n=1 Tax=Gigaspora margarita TaxID=4874 RepID=A0ABN7VRB5_GIGMA|nr:42928_t:CDS:2 [Gigaspora margarita]
MVGEWKEVKKTSVVAMYIVLARPTKILIIDKEYDLTTGKSRTLNLKTNVFCSARSFFENGTLIESGGAENAYMDSARWYNTTVTLPGGRVLNIGGSTKSIRQKIVKTLPGIPGGPRTYPVTEPFGDFNTGRLMGDYIHMPDGKVLVLVWVMLVGIKVTLPIENIKLCRVYHSTTTLIPDGTIFIAGSNRNSAYYDTCEYPTEQVNHEFSYFIQYYFCKSFRYHIEIFTPPYLLKGISQPIIRNIVDTTLQLLNTDSNKIWCGSHHID